MNAAALACVVSAAAVIVAPSALMLAYCAVYVLMAYAIKFWTAGY